MSTPSNLQKEEEAAKSADPKSGASTNPKPGLPKETTPWADDDGPGSRLYKAVVLPMSSDEARKDRASLLEIIKCCESPNPAIREGGLNAMIDFVHQTTKISKKEIRRCHRGGIAQVIGDRQVIGPVLGTARPAKSAKHKGPPKRTAGELALLAKYPDAASRGIDSEYARELRELRASIKASKQNH